MDNNIIPKLSISSNKIPNCISIALFLSKQGIQCKTIDTYSSVQYQNRMHIEKGCDIQFISFPKNIKFQNVWNILQNTYGLNCGHLDIPGTYNGCIYNYFQSYKCPYNNSI